MAVQHLNFKDFPLERRAKHGTMVIRELRRALLAPGLPEEHRQQFEEKIAMVSSMMRDPSAQEPLPPPGQALVSAPGPKHHTIVVTEDVSVDEDMK